MDIIGLIRGQLPWVILIALVVAGMVLVPKLARATPDVDYDDFHDVDLRQSLSVDASVTLRQYRSGDILMYRTEAEGTGSVCLAYVAALPGEEVAIRDGVLLVNDRAVDLTGLPRGLPDRATVAVPRDHLWVVSHGHDFDSFACGPIPLGVVLGRHGG